MSFDGVERRRHPRHAHTDNIEYCLNPTDLTTIFQGICINISESGMCLYTFKPIYAGQKILIKNVLPVPYQKAEVIWVKEKSEDLYRAGLMFIE